MKRLSENKMALFNIMSTVLIAGINFFTIPIFTRLLDTSGYGIVSIYTAWVQIATVIVGLRVDGTVGPASANLNEKEQNAYQLSIGVLALAVFALLFLASLLFLDQLSVILSMDKLLVICMMLQSIGSLLITLCNMRFIFNKQAHLNFAMSVGLCIATTFLSVLLVCYVFHDSTFSYYGRVLGLAIPNLIIGLVSFVIIFRRYITSFSFKYWHFCLPLALPLIFHGLSQLVLSQTDKIFLQQSYGDSQAGIYSIAVTVVTLLNSIYGALNNAFVPFMYDDLAGKNSNDVKQRHFKNYFVEFTAGTIAFAMLSPEILKLMSTEAYWSALDVLPLLVIGQYCVFLYSFPVNFEFYKMKTKSIAIGTSLAAAVNFGINLVLIPQLGMWGAAISTFIAYLALFLFHYFVARVLLDDRNYPSKYYFCGLTLVTVAALSYFFLSDFIIARWIIGFLFLSYILFRILRSKTIF